jgi:hypothetical protein
MDSFFRFCQYARFRILTHFQLSCLEIRPQAPLKLRILYERNKVFTLVSVSLLSTYVKQTCLSVKKAQFSKEGATKFLPCDTFTARISLKFDVDEGVH